MVPRTVNLEPHRESPQLGFIGQGYISVHRSLIGCVPVRDPRRQILEMFGVRCVQKVLAAYRARSQLGVVFSVSNP